MDTRVTIAKDFEPFRKWIETIPQRFGPENGMLISAKKNQICCFTMPDGRKIVAKRFKMPNWLQQLWYSLNADDKAIRSYRNAVTLRQRNVDTPRAIACIEICHNHLLKQSYYLYEFSENMPVSRFMTTSTVFDRGATRALARFVANLHEKGVMHLDLCSGNVTYHATTDKYSFSLIDLNRMRFYDKGEEPNRRECLENLTMFIEPCPLFTEFLRTYIAERKWDASTLKEAMRIKRSRDRVWKWRKMLRLCF